MKKKNVIEMRYSIAMRLWSPVNSQLIRPSSAVMKFFFGIVAVAWSGKFRIEVAVALMVSPPPALLAPSGRTAMWSAFAAHDN
jgi:hypothetical protein